jgi:hypothetical protein
LESDEEEVEDLHPMEHIEEILCATYERKTRGVRYNEESSTPIQIRIRVEPTTPCTINTSTNKYFFREPTIDSQRNLGEHNRSEGTSRSTNNSVGSGTSGSTSSNTNGSSSLNNNTQIVVPHREGTTHSTMTGVDPTIRLPEFHGDGRKYPEKKLFMCERIWEVEKNH